MNYLVFDKLVLLQKWQLHKFLAAAAAKRKGMRTRVDGIRTRSAPDLTIALGPVKILRNEK